MSISKVSAFFAAALLATSPLHAGDGAECTRASAEQCADKFAKLNLSEEQKAKVAALKEDCEKEGCTEASEAKMQKGLEEILTKEQLAQWKADTGRKAHTPQG